MRKFPDQIAQGALRHESLFPTGDKDDGLLENRRFSLYCPFRIGVLRKRTQVRVRRDRRGHDLLHGVCLR